MNLFISSNFSSWFSFDSADFAFFCKIFQFCFFRFSSKDHNFAGFVLNSWVTKRTFLLFGLFFCVWYNLFRPKIDIWSWFLQSPYPHLMCLDFCVPIPFFAEQDTKFMPLTLVNCGFLFHIYFATFPQATSSAKLLTPFSYWFALNQQLVFPYNKSSWDIG